MDFCDNNTLRHKEKSPVQNTFFFKFGYVSVKRNFWLFLDIFGSLKNVKNQCCFSLFDIQVLYE